jgi:hypothetical protein
LTVNGFYASTGLFQKPATGSSPAIVRGIKHKLTGFQGKIAQTQWFGVQTQSLGAGMWPLGLRHQRLGFGK